ncbi:DnaJ domain-containing protein, partial [Talaromyces proteolyticus]
MPLRLTTSRRLSPSVTFFFKPSPLHPHFRGTSKDSVRSSASAARFSTTRRVYYARSREPTYYEVLNIPVTATAAEIKKQFYALSLKHHPDRNRSDPSATERFATISSAYQILGDNSKRARYDRDHGIVNQNTHSSGVSGQHPMGSHSSAGANLRSTNSSYVGSRPASGLSKRRGTFKGPPPSFYAHGGYGARASRPGAGGAYTGTGTTGSNADAAAPNEEDPTSFINHNPIGHFNAKGHFRTQAAEDARRQQRRVRQTQREQEIRDNALAYSGNLILRFVIVSGILVSTAVLGGL